MTSSGDNWTSSASSKDRRNMEKPCLVQKTPRIPTQTVYGAARGAVTAVSPAVTAGLGPVDTVARAVSRRQTAVNHRREP